MGLKTIFVEMLTNTMIQISTFQLLFSSSHGVERKLLGMLSGLDSSPYWNFNMHIKNLYRTTSKSKQARIMESVKAVKRSYGIALNVKKRELVKV